MQICHECGAIFHHIYFWLSFWLLAPRTPSIVLRLCAAIVGSLQGKRKLSVFSSNGCMEIEIRALVTVLFLYPLFCPWEE
jgi:hypothetical protein